MKWKNIAFAATAVLILGAVVFFPRDRQENYREKYTGVDLEAGVEGLGRQNTYTSYRLAHADDGSRKADVEIPLLQYSHGTGVQVLDTYEGERDILMTEEDSRVEWEIDIPETDITR